MWSRKGPVTLLLLAALAPFALDGCVSIGIVPARAPAAAGTGAATAGVEVAVYADVRSRDARTPIDHPVFTHLLRLEERGDVPVARSLAPEWRLDGLPPGTYRLEATKEIDARGDIHDLPQRAQKRFILAAGQTARLEVLRKKVPVVLVVLAAITIVALAVVLIVLAAEGDLPSPPPLPDLPLPPLDVAVAIDLAFAAGSGRGPAPAVADIFPAPGSVVAARRVAVGFLLAAPLSEDPEPGAIQALGSLSGEIPGAISYLPEEQLLRFRPERDFTPGETVTVTLDLARIRGPEGRHGEGPVSTRFTVPEE